MFTESDMRAREEIDEPHTPLDSRVAAVFDS